MFRRPETSVVEMIWMGRPPSYSTEVGTVGSGEWANVAYRATESSEDVQYNTINASLHDTAEGKRNPATGCRKQDRGIPSRLGTGVGLGRQSGLGAGIKQLGE